MGQEAHGMGGDLHLPVQRYFTFVGGGLQLGEEVRGRVLVRWYAGVCLVVRAGGLVD